MYRTIEDTIWSDPWFEALKPAAKLLFLHLLTNPRQTACGAFEVSAGRLCAESGLSEPHFAAAMAELVAIGKVAWWPDRNWVFVVRFFKRQGGLANPKFAIAARKAVANLPAEVVAVVAAAYPMLATKADAPSARIADDGDPEVPHAYPMDAPCMGNHIETATESGTATGTEGDTTAPAGAGPGQPGSFAHGDAPIATAVRGQRPANVRARDPTWPDLRWIDAFHDERFWPIYPRKTHKAESRAAMRARMSKEPNYEAAFALGEAMLGVLSEQSRHWTDPSVTPHPATYVNGERWTDEIIIPTGMAAGRRR